MYGMPFVKQRMTSRAHYYEVWKLVILRFPIFMVNSKNLRFFGVTTYLTRDKFLPSGKPFSKSRWMFYGINSECQSPAFNRAKYSPFGWGMLKSLSTSQTFRCGTAFPGKASIITLPRAIFCSVAPATYEVESLAANLAILASTHKHSQCLTCSGAVLRGIQSVLRNAKRFSALLTFNNPRIHLCH